MGARPGLTMRLPAACLLRPSALSLAYLLFLLLLPWLPGPARHSIPGKGWQELLPELGGAGPGALCPPAPSPGVQGAEVLGPLGNPGQRASLRFTATGKG